MIDLQLTKHIPGKLVIPSDYPDETKEKLFYRYVGICEVWEYRFKMLKETPCGYWITNIWDREPYDYKRWVSKTARKRYAYPTRKEALESYIKRKERQLAILTEQIDAIREGLVVIKAEYEKEN